jgi:hypothetical protein
MDIGTGGQDAGQNQVGLGVGVASNVFTIGGFGLYCDATDDGASATGSISVTCTQGGNPVPRTMVDLTFDYLCMPCSG